MYMALARRVSWWWAVGWAVLIEISMLFSPYPQFFGFAVTSLFLAVTLSAHALFGVALGLQVRCWKKEGKIAHA